MTEATRFAQLFDMADLTQLFLMADSEGGGYILGHLNGQVFNTMQHAHQMDIPDSSGCTPGSGADEGWDGQFQKKKLEV